MLKILALIATAFVALSHVGILILEMFFWTHPIGQEIFEMTPEDAQVSAVLAMNQGLYNGFLAAGLFWGLMARKTDVKIFFLSCVLVAGIYGSLTAMSSILFTQAMPAFIALIFVLLAHKQSKASA